MTNQGYRINGIGFFIIGIWALLHIPFAGHPNLDLLPIAATAFFFLGWAVQSSMFSKLKPEDQIRIGYASREDFDLGPTGELIDKHMIVERKPE